MEWLIPNRIEHTHTDTLTHTLSLSFKYINKSSQVINYHVLEFFFLGLNKYSFIKKKEKEHTKKGGPHSRTENDKFYYSIIGKAKVFKKRVYS